MRLVRDRQRLTGFVNLDPGAIKADGSMQAITDLKSEVLAQRIFAELAPGVAFESEEGAVSVGDPRKKRAGYDPNDGSRALEVGAPTSTIINTIYNPDGSVYGAMIGEPATGRIFSAFGNERTHGRLVDLDSGATLRHARKVTAWQGELSDKGQVFIDNNRPHAHLGHATLLGEQYDQLRSALRKGNIATQEHASNGAHQLYVASGANRAAAAITTVRGNPEDTAAGAFLVERSGGAVQRINAVDGVITLTQVESPSYDLLVAANNQRTLDAVCGLLVEISR